MGLIAVGTSQTEELRVRNTGTVPVSFAAVQAGAATFAIPRVVLIRSP